MAKKNTKTEKSDPLRITPEFAEIELNKIESNPWQPRKTAPTDEEIADLMSSIKAVGQTSPIRVRPNPLKENRFQVGDGAMRIQAMRALGLKTIRAIIEPLSDKQMKILAIAANIFVKLRDSDKEKAIYELWESEYKGEGDARGQKSTTVFTNVREMERETGIAQSRLTLYLQSYVGRMAITREAPKELKVAVKEVSSRDMESIAQIAKESTKIAQQLVQARASDTIKPAEVREIVKTLQETPAAEREKVAQDILTAKKDGQKAIEKAAAETKARIERIHEERESEEERVKKSEEKRTKDEEAARLKELKDAESARVNKEKLDAELLQSYIKYLNNVVAYFNDDKKRKTANVRSDSVRKQIGETIQTIAATISKFAEQYRGK